MPVRSSRVKVDYAGRRRVTVELGRHVGDMLDVLLDEINRRRGRKPIGISDVIRAAVRHFHGSTAWQELAHPPLA